MRRLSVLALVALVACTSGEEIAPTTSGSPPDGVPTTTSTTDPPQTTTTLPATTTTSVAPLPPLQGLAYEEVATLPFPIQLTARPDATISYVITKDGRVWLLEDGVVGEEPVLDIRDRVRASGNEQGLLSMTLHPTDPNLFYLHWTAGDGGTVVAEYRFDSPDVADADSERSLLRLDQPAANHNGGMLQFGPDGRLLVGLGDGGGAGDTYRNGQNRDTLLGGLVSLSVEGDPSPTLYAYGLRNPWRFWIDEGLVYIADVGQSAFEEVSVAPLEAGHNFGWPITEGTGCFRPSSGCDTSGLVLPVIEVAHGDAGTCSISGGVVYRGFAIPELEGHYFYSDFCGGYLRSLVYRDGEVIEEADWTEQVGVPGQVVGFGVDGEWELYVLTTDRLLKLVPVR